MIYLALLRTGGDHYPTVSKDAHAPDSFERTSNQFQMKLKNFKFILGSALSLILAVSCKNQNDKTAGIKKGMDTVNNISFVPDLINSKEKTLDLKVFYDAFNLDGMFVLYDPKKKEYRFHNKSLFNLSTTPASTFNITTTLIALEEGICENENSIMKWNGYVSKNHLANKDIPLQFAFRNNIDWYFWELRKLIGVKRMRYWLDKLDMET